MKAEPQPFAARLEAEEGGSALVVVWAQTPVEAQELSGLVMESFRAATAEEVDEWQELADEPLAPREAQALRSMIAKRLRAIGRSRRRDRVRGRWPLGTHPARDANRTAALRLVLLAAKLDLIRDESEDA